ncbi:hydroxyethylthiazole kinase [Corynebacterium yonathiae]|uniref:Hydroxyethylthiazole kinase n=1 Tax=Corynebacterium yonathiae TaxID=2913504 RepID=A0A9X3LVU5_9CORY|nr:hydroxyethylthiazole kinase [Corynebacterium sp. BWA136]MCZ9294999.1 hydroxyethylthiazole kinase [Corynebacterium yonathiae]MDK2582744.1 hydroxyethylthiazole kinase [Corynebacterium sp. BWA136]
MDYAFLRAHDAVRESTPLIQCLTNKVVSNVTANALLAIGASPAMVDTPEESGEFAQVASGILINCGTPSSEQYGGMRAAIAGASSAQTPWVLDPVGAGGLTHRTEFMREVLPQNPAAIRGNASEIIALEGTGRGGRGVESTDGVEAALDSAVALSRDTGAVVAISGPHDLIVHVDDEIRAVYLHSGHPMLQNVIGTGCSLGAICAAYLAAWEDPFEAIVAAHAHVGAAGSVAAEKHQAPGSFAVAWLDALFDIPTADIEGLIKVTDVEGI